MAVTGTTRGRSVLTVTFVGSLVALSVLLATSHRHQWDAWAPSDAAPSTAKGEELAVARPGPGADGPGGQRWRGRTSEFGMEKMRVPSVAELLAPAAPAASFYDGLRNDLRYLTSDSWSGMTGQFTSAIALIHVARRSQRVAIVPSWQDNLHYGDNVISMSLLFDLQGFRERTGSLVVEWADVKAVDRHGSHTTSDRIGCYQGPNNFLGGESFPSHNIHPTLFPRSLTGGSSTEALILFDMAETDRLKRARAHARKEQIELPLNMKDGSLLCYTSLWEVAQATGGFSTGAINPLLPAPLRGFHTEWWDVGQHMNFSQPIWDIALHAVRETVGGPIPTNIVTVHIRRGDFGEKCGDTPDCLPMPSHYAPHVSMMLDRSPLGTVVVVTTDENTDHAFLRAIDELGWFRINHEKLGTEAVLKLQFGVAHKWADAAVDQAILALGDHFVGTDGSQVSWVSGERVQAWQGGTFSLVGLVWGEPK